MSWFFVFQVKMVLSKLYENKKIASATHNIYAYRSVMSHILYMSWPNMCHGFIMQIMLSGYCYSDSLVQKNMRCVKSRGLSVFSKGHITALKVKKSTRVNEGFLIALCIMWVDMCVSLCVCVFLNHACVSSFCQHGLMRSMWSCSCTAWVVITVDI